MATPPASLLALMHPLCLDSTHLSWQWSGRKPESKPASIEQDPGKIWLISTFATAIRTLQRVPSAGQISETESWNCGLLCPDQASDQVKTARITSHVPDQGAGQLVTGAG